MLWFAFSFCFFFFVFAICIWSVYDNRPPTRFGRFVVTTHIVVFMYKYLYTVDTYSHTYTTLCEFSTSNGNCSVMGAQALIYMCEWVCVYVWVSFVCVRGHHRFIFLLLLLFEFLIKGCSSLIGQQCLHARWQ